MKRLLNVLVILLSLTLPTSFTESVLGKLKIRVLEDDIQNVWKYNDLKLVNENFSMSLNHWGKKWTKYDSIPKGKYKLVFHSVFKERFEREIEIKPITKFSLDLSEVYVNDYSYNLFIDSLKENDSLKIYVIHLYPPDYDENIYVIHKSDSTYQIKVHNDNGKASHVLLKSELVQLRELEKVLRKRVNICPNIFSTSKYYYLVGNKLVNCGIGGGDRIKLILKGHIFEW